MGASEEESPPKGPRKRFPELDPKFGVVGDVMVSFSSSSATLCIAPVSSLDDPKGFEFAPKGLVKPGLVMFRPMFEQLLVVF